MQPIHVWCLQDRVSVGGDIAEALVIREDEDDVGSLASDGFRMEQAEGKRYGESEEMEFDVHGWFEYPKIECDFGME
jgi:hypothetical protein